MKRSGRWAKDKVAVAQVEGALHDSGDQIPDAENRVEASPLDSGPTGEELDFDEEFEKEFAELERETASLPSVIVWVFAAIAILALAIATIWGIGTGRALSRERSAPGQVVDLVVRKDQDGQEFYYPVVEFYLPNESRQTVQLSEGSWPPAYAKGEPVTVLYDPARPLRARIRSGTSTALRWIGSIITGGLGVAFLAAALFARQFLKPSPAPAQPE